MSGLVRSAPGRSGSTALGRSLAAILIAVLALAVMPIVAIAPPPAAPKTLYVDAVSGDDTTGDGTVGNPLKTIGAAVATATPLSTVYIAEGTYDIALGESFPIDLPPGVALIAKGDPANTIVDGSGAAGRLVRGLVWGNTVDGLTFKNAPNGALQIEADESTITACVFYENAVFGSGAGLYISGADEVVVTDSTFEGNLATGSGGGLFAESSLLEVDGCTFVENTASGLVASRETPSFEEDATVFIGSGFGGGIAAVGCMALVWDSTLQRNTAELAGGGAYAQNSMFAIVESTVESNTTTYEPDLGPPPGFDRLGATSDPDLVAGTVEPSEYGGAGGGVAVTGSSDAIFLWSEFSSNEAWMPGGVYVESTSWYWMYDCDVLENVAAFKGGGVASFPWVPMDTVKDEPAADASESGDFVLSTMREKAALEGFALPAISFEETSGVEKTVFEGNVAPYGSALSAIYDTIWVANCLFASNDTSVGVEGDAALMVLGGQADVWNSTFTKNTGLTAAIRGVVSAEVTVTNSVFWDNSFREPSIITDEAAPPVFSRETAANGIGGYDTENCFVSDSDTPLGDRFNPPGPGNIAVDPLFKDPASGDYRLTADSDCVDSGAWNWDIYEDLDGFERPYDGDGDDSADFDMGAYEYGPTERIFGDSRYQTSVDASQEFFPGGSDTVVLATGEVFADGLSASGLAGAYWVPLLLTRSDAVPAEVMNEIERLGAEGVVLVGGLSAISPTVVKQLEDAGLVVTRIGGNDRYETAALVALEIADVMGPDTPDVTFVARGDRFPDALALSPTAFWLGAPILLVRPDALPASTVDILEGASFSSVVVAGGKEAVDAHVTKQIFSMAGSVDRVSGADRYATAAALAEHAVDQGWSSWALTGLATGEHFADALTGGAGIGTQNGVLLLTPSSSLDPATAAALAAHKPDIARLKILGGATALTPGVMADARALVE